MRQTSRTALSTCNCWTYAKTRINLECLAKWQYYQLTESRSTGAAARNLPTQQPLQVCRQRQAQEPQAVQWSTATTWSEIRAQLPRQLNRATQLHNQREMLSFSRPGPLVLELFEIGQLLEDRCESLCPSHQTWSVLHRRQLIKNGMGVDMSQSKTSHCGFFLWVPNRARCVQHPA